MNIQEQIKQYIKSQPEPKQADIQTLHNRILQLLPKCKLWFLDGKDAKGKVVTNPNVGYRLQTIKYADGKTKDVYQTGISGNTTEFQFMSWVLKTKSIYLRPTEKQ